LRATFATAVATAVTPATVTPAIMESLGARLRAAGEEATTPLAAPLLSNEGGRIPKRKS